MIMSNSQNFQNITREDCEKVYSDHLRDHNQGYHRTMNKFATEMYRLIGESPFTVEGWKKIIDNDGFYNKAKAISMELFAGDRVMSNRFERLLDNTRDVSRSVDRNGFGIEGWGGGTAVYASSLGSFAQGTTPFIIGGWLATARSGEIFQNIDNQNKMRLEFEYNIDYLQVGDREYYFPHAFRSGDIAGFNKLPLVDWVSANTVGGVYTAPEPWCGDDGYIKLGSTPGVASAAKGNFLEVSKFNKQKNGIEPNCRFTGIKYLTDIADPTSEVEKRVQLHYTIAAGPTNERVFRGDYVLENIDVGGDVRSVPFSYYMSLNLDTGDFTIMTSTGDAATNEIIKGIKVELRVSNIANEFTNIPTMGTRKFQFIRECEYRNYSKVSLNEYMADNFSIGTSNNISYAAYATDKMLQATVFNQELEAEEFLINDVLYGNVSLDSLVLTKKMGGFINTSLSFNVNRFAPGLELQDYKFGLKNYINKVLATAETDLNIPASVKREWILLGYDSLVSEFPDIKFENTASTLSDMQSDSQTENFGFAIERIGYIDNFGRHVRLIGNNDSRWRDRVPSIYGTLRTYSMEYPFLVYYPHAIRMFNAIDADMPNRTAIYIGGREFRGNFATAAIQLQLNGVLDHTNVPLNTYEKQVEDAKSNYTYKELP